jgi:dolichol-phosphate mannosyltransferase
MIVLLLVAQCIALAVLLRRLARGRRRRAPVPPADGPRGAVSVVVATLDEAARIGPCLAGLRRQGPEMLEALVVDSDSRDGTRDLVRQAAAADPRIRLVDDGPLPAGWVGKVWALERGLQEARAPWVLGLDADTEPQSGLVGGVLAAATALGYDAVSFAPRFAGQGAAERWLQPALLTTLVYRFGPAGDERPDPERVMANGQCFLARRDVLLRHGGHAAVRDSFCDDVSLARHLARAGARVGFLDGSRLFLVRAYASARETWREWGRSLDLKDAATPGRQALDVLFLILVQGLPLALLVWLLAGGRASAGVAAPWLLGVNAALVGVRVLVQVALRGSYERRGLAFWLSPLADPLAALRIVLSSVRRPRRWRGREYPLAA